MILCKGLRAEESFQGAFSLGMNEGTRIPDVRKIESLMKNILPQISLIFADSIYGNQMVNMCFYFCNLRETTKQVF